MNFVEYTEEKTIKELTSGAKRILVIGAGYGIWGSDAIVQHDPTKDIADWICEYRNKENYTPFDTIIASRVLEHIEARKIDWYICCLYSILHKSGKLIIVVPDMSKVSEELDNEFSKPNKDLFKINRLHFELFSEGPSIWDRHACWMSPNSIKYYLEMEGLFTVESMKNIRLDSNIVPDEIEVIARRV